MGDQLASTLLEFLQVAFGKDGPPTVGRLVERTAKHWGRALANEVLLDAIKQANRMLGRNFVTRYGTRQGIIVIGRLAPFGFGLAIGGAGNAFVARGVIHGARRAFGPSPTSWDRDPFVHAVAA